MSAKSAIKTVVPVEAGQEQQGEHRLFRWVAVLTGSKNALKGVGFFLGGRCPLLAGVCRVGERHGGGDWCWPGC